MIHSVGSFRSLPRWYLLDKAYFSVRVPARNRWYTQGKPFEELVKGQCINIRAGLRDTKELGTADHPRGVSNS